MDWTDAAVLGAWTVLSLAGGLVMAKKRAKKAAPVPVHYEHPSQDNTGRFETDQVLRRHGFSIHKRLGDLILWKKDGEVYHENEVVEMVDQYALADAEYAEYLYEESLKSGRHFDE